MLLVLSGVLYTAGLAFCVYVAIFHVIQSPKTAYQSQIVWPILVLCLGMNQKKEKEKESKQRICITNKREAHKIDVKLT